VSKEVRSQEGKKPVTFTHVFAMTALVVVIGLVGYWLLAGIVHILFFFVEVILVVGLIAAVFWLISRFRN
jgi:hypothetical protein